MFTFCQHELHIPYYWCVCNTQPLRSLALSLLRFVLSLARMQGTHVILARGLQGVSGIGLLWFNCHIVAFSFCLNVVRAFQFLTLVRASELIGPPVHGFACGTVNFAVMLYGSGFPPIPCRQVRRFLAVDLRSCNCVFGTVRLRSDCRSRCIYRRIPWREAHSSSPRIDLVSSFFSFAHGCFHGICVSLSSLSGCELTLLVPQNLCMRNLFLIEPTRVSSGVSLMFCFFFFLGIGTSAFTGSRCSIVKKCITRLLRCVEPRQADGKL